MAPDTLMSHDEVEAALSRIDTEVSAAESHGLLCAMLAVDPTMPLERWLSECLPDAGENGSDVNRCRQTLGRLGDQTRDHLVGPGSRFHPLLPDDDTTLSRRTEALAEWCSAFLYGLGLAGVDQRAALSEEVGEFMRDLSELSRVDAGQDDEAGERAWAEVIEYVRIGVLLACEDLGTRVRASGPGQVH